jgi:hypothetical protein
MSKSISKILDELRSKLGAAEQRQVELNAEILEISWAANTGDAKAKARIDAITNELAHLATEVKSVTAALAEGARRETQARDAEISARRRADAEQADKIMLEAETLAATMDGLMASLKVAAVDLQDKMAMIRRLSGAGPQHSAIRVHLARAISSGLTGLPQHPDLLAPNERHSVADLTTAWAAQVRHVIATLETAAEAA